MQVKITKKSKKWLTVAQMPIVHQIISDLKDDESTAAEYAMQAADIILHANFGYEFSSKAKVFEATAEISRNERIYNYYGEESEHLDIWINFVVFDDIDGVISGGAYLSDIWSLTADNKPEIVNHMYYQIYMPVKKV